MSKLHGQSTKQSYRDDIETSRKQKTIYKNFEWMDDYSYCSSSKLGFYLEKDDDADEILNNFNPNLAAMEQTSLMDFGMGLSLGNQFRKEKHTIAYNFLFSYKNTSEFYKDAIFARYGLNGDKNDTEMQTREYQSGDYGVNNVLISALGGVSFKTLSSKYSIKLLHLQNGESKAGIFDFINADQGAEFYGFQHNLEYSQRSLTNLYIGAKYNLAKSKWKIDWKVSPTYSNILEPDIRFTRYEDKEGVWSISTESGFPERIWRELSEVNIVTAGNAKKEISLLLQTTDFDEQSICAILNGIKLKSYSFEKYKTLSGTELRQLLDQGKGIPEWFTFKSVAHELERSNPPLAKRGLTIFFTGLSGSGKSTLANGLVTMFLEEGSRPVTLLDGDIVRTHLSSELGFSKEHRSINIKRIGFVASEITKNGGIAICAPIAPYRDDRAYNRKLISNKGGYLEIFVNTPLKKCEERDSKGLYALAREGKIKEFTGISDPYEEPKNAEIVINSSGVSPKKLVNEIYEKIVDMGYIRRVK